MNPGRPEPNEHAPYFAKYIAFTASLTDPIAALELQLDEVLSVLRLLDSAKQLHRYAPGKWSIKEVVNHLTDTERIFAYRAMRIARNDKTALPGFDQDPFIEAAAADHVEWSALVREFELVRNSTVQMLRNLPDAAWTRIGTASSANMSVRAMVWIMYGHVAHHLGILKERY